MSSVIQQGYFVDGQVFATKSEANDYVRRPQVEKALLDLSGGDTNLAKFLKENEDEIMKAFEAGVIARVTKMERKRAAAGFAELKTIVNPKLKFLQDNADSFVDTFRWPAVKRLKPEEKAAETLAALTTLADASAAKWIMDNQKALEEAFDAGIPKHVPPSSGGLQEFLAAKKAGPEAMAAYEAAKAAREAAKKAAKAKA